MNTVVSGALDRLHYEKDPCVKYDIGRKLWIYLHRHRTQEEFGKQQLFVRGSKSEEKMYTISYSRLCSCRISKLPFFPTERIHQAQAAAAKARKALQQKPKPASKPVSPLHSTFYCRKKQLIRNHIYSV